jgi:NAD(P)H-dependent FMN reductase
VKIAIIIGSVREGRQSDKLAKWVAEEAKRVADVEIVDLKEYPLPFMKEEMSPRHNPERRPEPAVQHWLDKVVEFDGYVFVTPEYNRSTSAVLKNAIDHFDYQLEKKPVALVGHGSSGGAQAIASLRMIIPGTGAVTIPEALFFTDRVGEAVDEAVVLKEELRDNPYGPQNTLEGQMESLAWYAEALKAAREK